MGNSTAKVTIILLKMNYTECANNSTDTYHPINFQQMAINMVNQKISSCDEAWTDLVYYLQDEYGWSEMVIFLAVGFAVHAIAFQGFNLIYALIIRSGLVEEYKIQQNKFVPFADRLKIIPNLLKHRIIQALFSVPLYFLWKFAGGDLFAPLPSVATLVGHFYLRSSFWKSGSILGIEPVTKSLG